MMIKSVLPLTTLAMLLVLSPGCCQTGSWIGTKGEGPVIERILDVSNFSGVTLENSAQVILIPGDQQQVRVEGQENIIALLSTDVTDDVWRIRFKEPVSFTEPFRVYITMNQLRMARISGSGDIRARGLFAGDHDLELKVSGSGSIHLEVEADDIRGSISGSGGIRLEGRASEADLSISGSGNMYLEDMQIDEASVRISGSGNMYLNVTEWLDARITGSGDIRYTGRPKINTRVSGSGQVISK
ncbi:MAG: head GIN domain-containing protein [Bacteroidales bacterium]|jgi:hypothetical protein